ncbi:hypothetical protein [Arcticibacter tournemirensis]
MVILDTKGGIHGKAGNVIYRRYRGMTIVQGQPKKFQQTVASRESSSEFGMSSSCGRIIREAFLPAYRDLYDGGMINRLSRTVYQCIRNSRSKGRGERDLHDGELGFLEGMEFNLHSRLSDCLKVKPAVRRNEKGQVLVSLPEINAQTDVVSPFKREKIDRYRLRFMLVAFNFRQEFYEYVGVKDVEMGREERAAAQELLFDGEVPQGSLLILMASVSCLDYNDYELRYESMNTKEYSPAALIATYPSKEEAPAGYGEMRVDDDVREMKSSGRPQRVFDMLEYFGNDILREAMWPKGKKVPKKTKPRRKEKASLNDISSLKGKRVKFY